VKFCQKEKLKIKFLSKSNFGGFSRQWGKEKKKKKKNHQILIFSSHCLAKKKKG
jgi:hypothetical protein